MKKFLVALALAAAAFSASARDDSIRADTITYDPYTVASATALSYPVASASNPGGVLDTGVYPILQVTARVENGGVSRLFIPKCYDKLGATLLYTYPTATVAINAQGFLVFDGHASSLTASTGTTVYPHLPCRYIKLTAASGGATTIQVTQRKDVP